MVSFFYLEAMPCSSGIFFASCYVNIRFLFCFLVTCIGDGSMITVTVNVLML